MPCPDDPGRPPESHQTDSFAWASRKRRRSPPAFYSLTFGAVPDLREVRVSPTAYMVPCVRFRPFVQFVFRLSSYGSATLGTGGWLDLTWQGFTPCKKRQACLGARVASQRAPVKGHERTSKSPALAGRKCLCGLRRPLQGRGSPVFEVDLYSDTVADLDSLPNATPLSLRRVDRKGSTCVATCEPGCGTHPRPRQAGLRSGAGGNGRPHMLLSTLIAGTSAFVRITTYVLNEAPDGITPTRALAHPLNTRIDKSSGQFCPKLHRRHHWAPVPL
jgi:hypothetical protein